LRLDSTLVSLSTKDLVSEMIVLDRKLIKSETEIRDHEINSYTRQIIQKHSDSFQTLVIQMANVSKQPPKRKCMFMNVPCEVFIDICKLVPPIDLVTLTTVCKKFRSWLLAPSNFGTEQIWSASRIAFIPSLKPPPRGISEQCYIFLYLIELGCQFCGAGKIEPHGKLPTETPAKIYWVFRVRCCKRCLIERTVTSKQIKEEKIIHDSCLAGVPFIEQADRPRIYWKSAVEAANREFVNIKEGEVSSWTMKKKKELEHHNKIAESCKIPTNGNKKARLTSVIRQLSSIVPNDAGRCDQQVKVELQRCPTFKKYVHSSTTQLFTEHHWANFQNIVYNEYNDKRNYAALRAQQYDIFLKVHSLIPAKYTMSDPLVQYLFYCPSFKKPPFNYWQSKQQQGYSIMETFIETKFIPRLALEANNIANESERPCPITTVSGVQKLGLSNRCIFRCNLCVEANWNVLLNHKEARNHLQTKHGIQKITNKNMIIVDYLEMGKNYLKRNSKLICFFFPMNDEA
ncbi:16908_t:CDS:2, partial [Cetraspora pellucida]